MNRVRPYLTAIFVCLVATGCAAPPPTVPAAIRAGSGERLVRTLYARGVQIYRCAPVPRDPARTDWALQAPEAELFTDRDLSRPAGRHFRGPTWESTDGSRVVGEVRASAPAPGAIPWLLLAARPGGDQGHFAGITSIQRIDTRGGLAPEGGCTPTALDREVRVEYSATYLFYTR